MAKKMTAPSDRNPFAEPVPEEVPLPKAPLVKVLAQVRFPTIASIEKPAFVGSFQELVRHDYPIMRREFARTVNFRDDAEPETSQETVWRFSTTDEKWQLALAPNFIALVTTAYDSRTNFIRRFGAMLDLLKQEINPTHVDRVGLRYINRITGDDLRQLGQLVRPEVLGVLWSSLAGLTRLALSETHFQPRLDEPRMLVVKSAMLPPRQTFDPGAVEPIDHPSWVFDLDAFAAENQVFEPAALVEQLTEHSRLVYSLFRWAVTDEFLTHFGGTK